MKKGKNIDLDGIIVELLLGFYNLIKDNLLKVVQESYSTSNILGPLNSTHLDLIPRKMDPPLSMIFV